MSRKRLSDEVRSIIQEEVVQSEDNQELDPCVFYDQLVALERNVTTASDHLVTLYALRRVGPYSLSRIVAYGYKLGAPYNAVTVDDLRGSLAAGSNVHELCKRYLGLSACTHARMLDFKRMRALAALRGCLLSPYGY
jgi:hypothetical protein